MIQNYKKDISSPTLNNPSRNKSGQTMFGNHYIHGVQSMRVKINPLIKSCCFRTVPTAVTKSIGLSADVQMAVFLLYVYKIYIDN
jgi:hypothetical protein